MKNKKGGLETLKTRYGYSFVAPWIFGIIVFVLIPLGQCFYYSFSEVSMTPEGLKTNFVGLQFYKYLFLEDAKYIDTVEASLSKLFTSIPIIIALSMILAIVLNQKFKGRLIARAVFFMPVIIASGAVMKVLTSFSMQADMVSAGAVQSESAQYMQFIDFSQLLAQLELPKQISSLLEGYLTDVFNLVWSCGVQILLFVAGLQTIPEQLYEVGRVEGITAWEEFWYITVPMLGRIILLVLFYTMVDLFISESPVVNSVIEQLNQQNYSKGSSMIWPYFILVGIVIGTVVFIYNKICLKRWE